MEDNEDYKMAEGGVYNIHTRLQALVNNETVMGCMQRLLSVANCWKAWWSLEIRRAGLQARLEDR